MEFEARIRVDKSSYYEMTRDFNAEADKVNFQKLLTNGNIQNDDDIISDTMADEIYIEENGDISPISKDEDSVYIVFKSFNIEDSKAYYYLLYRLECCKYFSYVFINLSNQEITENCNNHLYQIEFSIIQNGSNTTYQFPCDDVEEDEPVEKYVIHTDGACSGNPGKGGWAAIINHNGRNIEISGGVPETTNNQMELMAVIEALKQTPKGANIEVYSDSAYVVNAFLQGWLSNWIKRNWHTADNKPVANKEMWIDLVTLANERDVSFFKVAGHADNELNNRCDFLARTQCI